MTSQLETGKIITFFNSVHYGKGIESSRMLVGFLADLVFFVFWGFQLLVYPIKSLEPGFLWNTITRGILEILDSFTSTMLWWSMRAWSRVFRCQHPNPQRFLSLSVSLGFSFSFEIILYLNKQICILAFFVMYFTLYPQNLLDLEMWGILWFTDTTTKRSIRQSKCHIT